MTTTPSSHVVPAAKPGRPSRQSPRRRPRLSADLLAELANRLTARDRWLLHMLYEHRVLTTVQIAQLAYGAGTTAAHRLQRLWQLRAVDRQQPLVERGSAPMHYVLGDAGAAVLAAHHDITVHELGYRRDTAIGILHSAKIAHTVGVNSILAALVAHARRHPDTRLIAWWPERRCTQLWGDLARPDAYAHWRDGDTRVEFFLEYDTGSEPVHRLVKKLADYADLAHATGATTPVLFWFPTPAREANARTALRDAPIPVATAAPEPGNADPASQLWQPVGDQSRRRLAALDRLSRTSATDDLARPPGLLEQAPWAVPVAPMPPPTR
ncbi:MAG: hypothetical protein GEU83_20440 [Pseudonocardiaceae bacterium]|nr:hypothetical protein [Pseudonocardiaceae bacterium]